MGNTMNCTCNMKLNTDVNLYGKIWVTELGNECGLLNSF